MAGARRHAGLRRHHRLHALTERLAERGREGAEELNSLVSGCFEGMIENCAQHGGDIVKFGGDALLVWFTATVTPAACRAAVGMRRTIRRRRTTSTASSSGSPCRSGCTPDGTTSSPSMPGATTLIVSGPGATETVAGESAAAAGEILLSQATAATVPATWLGAARPEGVTLARLTTAQRRRRCPVPGCRPAAVERLRFGGPAGAGHWPAP